MEPELPLAGWASPGAAAGWPTETSIYVDTQFLIFVGIGFLAQMVDGALGMAFGVIASSSLMVTGASPAIASAAVHAAEIVTTAISGASHVWNKNVDRKLFTKLVVTGVAGGVLGAYVVTGLPEHIVRPLAAIYLAAMATLIFVRILKRRFKFWQPPATAVGGAGGFLDAIGGGGWGPLVASTLIAGGDPPRKAVGSVNLAEFFITVSVSVTFLTQLDLSKYGLAVLGLIVGGAMAAPLAGYLLRVLPMRAAMIMIGCVIAVLSVVNLASSFR
jgi:uncharacterized membrane protein YfcA